MSDGVVAAVAANVVVVDGTPRLTDVALSEWTARLADVAPKDQEQLAAAIIAMALRVHTAFAADASLLVSQLALLAATVLHTQPDDLFERVASAKVDAVLGGPAVSAAPAPEGPRFSVLDVRAKKT